MLQCFLDNHKVLDLVPRTAGWRYSSVLDYFPGMCKALDSIPGIPLGVLNHYSWGRWTIPRRDHVLVLLKHHVP